MLVSQVIFDPKANEVKLTALRAKYSLLNCLATKKLPADSDVYKVILYKAGVIVAFITTDQLTFFMERSADKFICGRIFRASLKKEGDFFKKFRLKFCNSHRT